MSVRNRSLIQVNTWTFNCDYRKSFLNQIRSFWNFPSNCWSATLNIHCNFRKSLISKTPSCLEQFRNVEMFHQIVWIKLVACWFKHFLPNQKEIQVAGAVTSVWALSFKTLAEILLWSSTPLAAEPQGGCCNSHFFMIWRKIFKTKPSCDFTKFWSHCVAVRTPQGILFWWIFNPSTCQMSLSLAFYDEKVGKIDALASQTSLSFSAPINKIINCLPQS